MISNVTNNLHPEEYHPDKMCLNSDTDTSDMDISSTEETPTNWVPPKRKWETCELCHKAEKPRMCFECMTSFVLQKHPCALSFWILETADSLQARLPKRIDFKPGSKQNPIDLTKSFDFGATKCDAWSGVSPDGCPECVSLGQPIGFECFAGCHCGCHKKQQ